MTIAKARKMLKTLAEGKTDHEVQEIIDRLKPLVDLAVKEAEQHFRLTCHSDLAYTGKEGGL